MAEIDEMSASEFREWFIYEKIEPFGDRRGDLQAGILAALTANVNRAPNRKAYSPSDFMPHWEEPQAHAVQTQEQQLEILKMIAAKQNEFVASLNG